MVIDGRQIAEEISISLKDQVFSKNLKLKLAVVLVGDDPEFRKFVELKGKAAEKVGVEFKIFQFDKNIDENVLVNYGKKICRDFNGVLVELPLPACFDQQKILDLIPVEKDVDVLSNQAQDLFYSNKSKIMPPAVEALKIIFEKYNIDLQAKKVAVFGQGVLIGKPIAYWLEQQGAEVYRIRSATKNPQEYSKKADIVISGVGKPGLITGDIVKEGAVVIDFGYGKKDNKMVGDVDLNSVGLKALLVTPVPGGMGPILIVAVLKNLIELNS